MPTTLERPSAGRPRRRDRRSCAQLARSAACRCACPGPSGGATPPRRVVLWTRAPPQPPIQGRRQ